MNREIKFRAFDGEMMIYPSLDGHGKITSGWILNNYSNVMQFTGLHDKNGVEIYEKDIVDDDELGVGLVVHQSGCFFMMYDADTNMEFLGLKNDKFGRLQQKRIVEIIGNVYQNQELINK